MIRNVLILLLTACTSYVSAQSSTLIQEDFERFKEFKTVLYLAAHPDDENTRVISWLVNGEHANTAYLSLTRGDGGQNLIGDEFGDALGILRTQELLAARKIDGGKQFFTRAVDFGYSRSAEETLEKWNEEAILADVVWVIRKFRPQLIITRFPPDERAGHGHHTASAMLAIKGAEAAADSTRFPEQLKYVSTWNVQSVYWNTSSWWDKTVEAEMDTSKSIWRADIGGYNANLGVSYNEIGSLARSQHKCQGFGVDIQRGETFEYFRYLWGKKLPNGLKDLDYPTWKDIGAKRIPMHIRRFEKEFDPNHPEESIRVLATIYKALEDVNDPVLRAQKQKACADLILSCGGFFAEALTADFFANPGDAVHIDVNLLSRNSNEFAIDGLQCPGGSVVFKTNYSLPLNQFATFSLDATAPTEISNPYWLQKPHGNSYNLENWVKDLGEPQNEPTLQIETNLLVDNTAIPLQIPVMYKWRDRVEGELQREFIVVPEMCINFDEPMSISLNGEPVEVKAKIKWFKKDISKEVKFIALGWDIDVLGYDEQNGMVTFEAGNADKTTEITLRLTPQDGAAHGVLEAYTPQAQVHSFQEISYSHIPTQVYMPIAKVSLTNLQVKTVGQQVAYIPGAGDQVADAIAQMGYKVDILDENNFASTDLSKYQAIVVGIRAYNTQNWIQGYTDKIMEYVQNGGNYIVQYNTASRFLEDAALIPAPFPFEVGRGRVTEEDSPVEILLKDHPVLNSPNKIVAQDFEGWVQERGLYFASTWDDAYAAPIGWHDKNQEMEKGGLIIADYGQGSFMYTGISFFRILPAGVDGGYRLLANLISYEAK